MAKPAARITDPTSCPMPGHGPKAIASRSPDVFFDGLAAARMGDTCTCGSALASAVSTAKMPRWLAQSVHMATL